MRRAWKRGRPLDFKERPTAQLGRKDGHKNDQKKCLHEFLDEDLFTT